MFVFKNYVKISLILFFFFTLNSCDLKNQKDIPIPEQNQFNITKIKINEDQNLQKFIQDFEQGFSSQRVSFRGQSINLNLKDAIKLTLPESNSIRYSLIIENLNEQPYSFSNLVIKQDGEQDDDGTQEFLVINYLPEKDWIESHEGDIDWSLFTGEINKYNLDGEHLQSANLKDGLVVVNSNSTGRKLDMYECDGSITCYWNSNLDRTFCSHDLVCDEVGSGDTGGSEDTGGSDTSGSGDTSDPNDGPENDGHSGGGTSSNDDGDSDGGSNSDPLGIYPPPIVSYEKQLKYELSQNPFALMEIDCEELGEKWTGLTEHLPNQEVLDRVNQLNQEGYDIEMQYLEDADGAVVNMDYFPVEISQLPENPATGQTFTGPEFFNHIRENFAQICYSDNSSFGPYNSVEAQRWNSLNYLGTVMRFDISVEFFGIIGSQDGSVLCTDQQSQSWIFSTIYTSQDYSHPVSGNRQFGLLSNLDGTYTFYTSGVDRIAEWTDVEMGELMDYSAFDGGEELWSNLQNNLKDYVSEELNGGVAKVGDSKVSRINIEVLEAVLGGTKPVSELDCN